MAGVLAVLLDDLRLLFIHPTFWLGISPNKTQPQKIDASIRVFNSYWVMDVLIVERDELIAEVFAAALAEGGITSEITADDEQAMDACHDSSTRVMITGISRRRGYEGHAVRTRDASPLPLARRGLSGGSVACRCSSARHGRSRRLPRRSV
jgi:hypothetical protein